MKRILAGMFIALALTAPLPTIADDKAERLEQLIRDLKNPDEQVRYQAAEALKQMGPEAKDAVPALIATLQDKKVKAAGSSVRYEAAEALGEIGAPAANKAIPALRAMLRDRQERSDIQAAAWAALMKIYRKDPDPKVRMNAAENMGHTGPWAVPFLKEMLNDPNETVRKAAEEGLTLQHVQETAEKLHSNNPGERMQALEELGRIGPPAKGALLMISQRLKDPDEKVRAAAAAALKKIEGK